MEELDLIKEHNKKVIELINKYRGVLKWLEKKLKNLSLE